VRQLRVFICGCDDLTADLLTELAAVDLPLPDLTTLQPTTALDDLEASVFIVGQAILRRLLQAAWEALDGALAAAYRERHPAAALTADGHEPLTVASRFGRLQLRRQVLCHGDTRTHILPGNAVLPAHEGIAITRGLQEWAGLLPQDLPFASVVRLLGWQTQEAGVLAATTVRTLVRRHGQLIRQAEQVEVAALLTQANAASLTPVLVPHDQPRRRAGWPPELNAAVEAALATEQVHPPVGVSWADWERVLAARRAEADRPIEDLRTLGPTLAEDEVLVTVDEVLTRKPGGNGFWEVRTAKLVTQEGYRYVSGTGEAFLQVLLALAGLWRGTARSLLLLSDGARWIRTFFTQQLADLPRKMMLLDWYHLAEKCRVYSSRICHGREAKRVFLRRLYRRLWAGKVPAAVPYLEQYRDQAKNAVVLEELIAYLRARAE
jgi:hypothetical protein